ncbi:alpha- mannosyltransferase [Ophiostoma piceae UAMH 11346]|uniref:Alpha-mannosyltransferase n=1 Tax=Ophiostoma piceae (strain UAMH 11346) TaxID=1262450 RepID=S3D156_OPHP1|nr:alpha- mannosyltransferase [Ophiostoma piceae UAMH 11346]
MVGNARYVRYIVIAFFVIAIVYFVSNTSDNVALRTPEMLGLKPSSASTGSEASSEGQKAAIPSPAAAPAALAALRPLLTNLFPWP